MPLLPARDRPARPPDSGDSDRIDTSARTYRNAAAPDLASPRWRRALKILRALQAHANPEGFVDVGAGVKHRPGLLARLAVDLQCDPSTIARSVKLLERMRLVEVLARAGGGHVAHLRVRLVDEPRPPAPNLTLQARRVVQALLSRASLMAVLELSEIARACGWRDRRTTWDIVQRLARDGFLTIHRRHGVRPHRYELHLDRIKAAGRKGHKNDRRT